MEFTHIRHGSHLLRFNGLTLLVDPVLAKKGTYAPIPSKHNSEENPLMELPFDLDFLKDIDAVLITHLHNDHFDMNAKEILDKNLPIICHSSDADKIKSFGFNNILSISNDFIIFKDLKISTTLGRHGYYLTAKSMGHVCGFIIEN